MFFLINFKKLKKYKEMYFKEINKNCFQKEIKKKEHKQKNSNKKINRRKWISSTKSTEIQNTLTKYFNKQF